MKKEKADIAELLELDSDMVTTHPMAVIELVDRDIQAKKIDIKEES